MKTIALRLILTAVIMVPVYYETGPWTVAALLLIALAIEIESLTMRRLLNALHSESTRLAAIRAAHALSTSKDSK